MIGPYPAGDIECVTTNVMAGQQIKIEVPPFLIVDNDWASVESITWIIYDCSDSTCATKTTPAVNAVGGYTASAQSGTVNPITPADLNYNPIQIYFTAPGHYEEVVVTGTFSDDSTISAWAIFNVQGPTGSFQPIANLQSGISGTVIGTYDNTKGCIITSSTPTANPACMSMGNSPNNLTVGAWFQEPMTSPQANPGRFIWVQILNSIDYSALYSTNSGYTMPINALNQLDGLYPYPSTYDVGQSQSPPVTKPSNYASDTPAMVNLYSGVGEAAESFNATMYVLWDPAIPPAGQSTCTPATVNTNTGKNPYIVTPSNCSSIPVPLGEIHWTWSACTINALTSPGPGAFTSNWIVQCGVGTQTTYETSVYPTWGSCYKSAFGGC
jgi:hypothetical protein